MELKMEHLTAVVDSREQNPWDLNPMTMVTDGLSVGDYSIRGLESVVAIERKSLQDFVACCGPYESFYSQGVILNGINLNLLYKDAGFDSFADYMNERQPCGIKNDMAYRLINAMKLRPLLPELTTGQHGGCVWSERSIRPLLHKDFTPADQKRIGKKIATQVKNGEKLTAKLVQSICDHDGGEHCQGDPVLCGPVSSAGSCGNHGGYAKVIALNTWI